jgi:hypothetical protein
MAETRDIPEMAAEFFGLAKRYLRDRTLVPAKRLGRLAAFSLMASIMFVLATLFLSVAVMRVIVGAMPDGAIWSGLGYITSAIALLVLTALIMWRAAR